MMRRLAIELPSASGRPDADAKSSMETPAELIARARRGDGESFRLLFERYTRPVISFLFYMVGRRALAEELAQETFLRAFRNLGALRDETKLSTWLFGIARNVAREELRAQGRAPRCGVGLDDPSAARLADEAPSPSTRLYGKELSAAVGAALGALDEDKRAVFVLKFYHGRSYEEIAAVTGFSPAKVRNDLHRARAEMRRRLKHYAGRDDEV
ncbi:MAG TPA: sigma-70 family RNA polymerase sigma factor [Pyrinomonadaceae bacterium]